MEGMDNQPIRCLYCKGNELTLKREAKYVYTYLIDADAPWSLN